MRSNDGRFALLLPYEVVSVGDASTTENAAADDAKHGGVDVSDHGVGAEQKDVIRALLRFRIAAKACAEH